jgi:heme-degrading monooxygenase HmoA
MFGSAMERGRAAMFARVSTLQGSPERVEDGIRAVREQVLPAARQMDGFKGLLAMVDRSSGKMVGITLWDSEEALQASEEAANQLRDSSAQAGGAQIAGVERFEVVVDEPV